MAGLMAAALAVLASVCYGVSNFIGPALSRDLPVYAVLILGQAVAFGVSGVVVAFADVPVPDAGVWGAAALAGVGNAWGLIAFYRAAAIGPLSIVTPIGSLGAVMPVLAGVASGEPLGPVKLAGLVLALGGVALATRKDRARPAPAAGGRHVRAAAAWALSYALGFGLFLTFMAPASEGGVFWAVMLSRAAVLAVMAAAAWMLAAPLRAPLARLPSVAVPGLLLFAGTLAYSTATREGDLSVVSVAGSLFPVVTVGLAFTFGGERLSRLQALGVASAIVGVVLVSLRS
jgi:drug/metabolite transporter (DMT)-like permease